MFPLHQRAMADPFGYDPKSEVLETSMLSVCTTDLKNVNKKYRLPGQESGTRLQIFRSGWCYSSLRIPSVTGMICFADTGMTKQRSWQNQNRSSSFLNCLQTIAYIILPFSFSHYSNQHISVKWSRQASNLQPSACKADALPFELQPHLSDRLCLPGYPGKAQS